MKYLSLILLAVCLGCGPDDVQDKAAAERDSEYKSDAGQVTEETKTANETFVEKGTTMANPKVEIKTTLGDMVIELDAESAPVTVKNFLEYVNNNAYDGTIFHRVIKGFMIQGGGMKKDLQSIPTNEPIINEAANGLKNERGTIAMARTSNPDSATSQFFINHADNAFLDYKGPTPDKIGYAVFGRVVEGMEVVDKIAAVPTGRKAGYDDVPLNPVEIISVREIR